MNNVAIPLVLKCTRCGHEWLRRDLVKLPRQCPACHSPYWDRPRVLAVKKVARRRK
jgi:predicted Zn-ribbon and HTH transcriptional regulator